MTIKSELDQALKSALRGKDSQLVDCIRQVKSKIGEAINAKDFKGEEDDDLYQNVIKSYVGSLKKGISELEAAGDRGKELRNKYQAEVDYLTPYLPALLGESETLVLVQNAIAALNLSDPKQSGRIIGHIMKDHKGKVDPALVKSLIEKELTK